MAVRSRRSERAHPPRVIAATSSGLSSIEAAATLASACPRRSGAGDRQHLRRSGQQPGQHDLPRAGAMPLGRLGVAVIAAAVGVLAVSPGTTLHAPNGRPVGVSSHPAPRTAGCGGWPRSTWPTPATGACRGSLSPGRIVTCCGLASCRDCLWATSRSWRSTPAGRASGFAFLQLRPGVSRVTADLGDGTRLRLRPVTVTVCGQRFRLARFRYPRQGVTRITARSAQGRPIGYTPLTDYFNPASPLQTGTWINEQAAASNVASGQIGSGNVGGMSWRMKVTLGPDGECFRSQLGPVGAVGGASICAPVHAPRRAPPSPPLPFATPAGAVIWYPGTVNARTASTP